MYSKFPFSMENIPRQKSFGCLSLKFGCLFSGLITILYTVLALAQCLAAIEHLTPGVYSMNNIETVMIFFCALALIVCHCVTLILTTVMVIGTLREKVKLMRPWVIWTSCQVMGNLLLLIFWTTVNMVVDHTIMDENSILFYVVALIGLLIRFYMLMLVSSYYKQLLDEGAERLKTLLSYDTWNA